MARRIPKVIFFAQRILYATIALDLLRVGISSQMEESELQSLPMVFFVQGTLLSGSALVYFLQKKKNWARLWLTFPFVFYLPFSLRAIEEAFEQHRLYGGHIELDVLAISVVIAQMCALALLYSRKGNEWFKS